MVALEQLRYVRLVAGDLGHAADFAQRVLGLEPIDRRADLAAFRSDFRDYTLAFATGGHAVQAVGLEVRYSEDLDAALERLRGLGVSAGRGSAEDCALRKVKDMIWLNDFSGNRVELVVRPLNSGWRYFPSRDAGIKGLAERDTALRRCREGRVDLVWCSRRANQRLGRRRGLSAFRR
jgi:2,3-dihydroxy-p-cumate/2,3-dihydroxybenzoate 3,4-dioxygenase